MVFGWRENWEWLKGHFRVLVVAFAFTILLSLVVSRLVKVHWAVVKTTGEAPNYTYSAEDNGVWALRGSIYSAEGTALAQSVTVWDYYVDPRAINPKKTNRRDVVTNVAAVLDIPVEKVLDVYCRTKGRFHFLCRNGETEANRLLTGINRRTMQPKAPGLVAVERQVRRYPQGRLGSQVIGYVSKDPSASAGVAGLESGYEKMLRGTPGRLVGARDMRRNELPEKRILKVDAVRGANITLTLRADLQLETEKILAEACATNGAEAAWAVVLDVDTGAVLAMASLPDFSPEDYNSSETDKEGFRNRVIAYNYEPGSVMKPLAAAAALQEGVCTPLSQYDVGMNRVWFYCGKALRDHPTGILTVTEAIEQSSNIAFAKIGLDLNPRRIYSYFTAFGFAKKTGIDLPCEEAGLLDKKALIHDDKLKVTRVPIGQGISVTQLQLARAYAAIANGGRVMKPYVVSRVEQEDGTLLYSAKPEVVRRPVTPQTARQVREMMRQVVEGAKGTGKRAKVRGYTVAGKTGTAQMPSKTGRGYSEKEYFATFAGMVPATEPKVAIVVTFANPQPKHTGGEVSAPVFSRIARKAMLYLEVPPDKPEEVMDDLYEE